MFFFRKKSAMVARDKALRGRANAIATARTHFLNGRELKAPYPDGIERAVFGMGCFWGAERKFWELEDGIWITAVGYAAGFTPNPTYEEVCSGADRPQRGGARRVRSGKAQLRAAAENFLGEPRPDAGHPPGQRRRHAVPLRHLRLRRPTSAPRPRHSREIYGKALAAKRLRRDHHRDPRRAGVLLRRGLSPAVPRQESRTAIAASAAPASPARSGQGVKAAE